MATQPVETGRIQPWTMAIAVAAMLLCLPAAAPRAEIAELRIGVQFGVGYLPVYVAQAAGLIDARIKEAGLAPVPVTIQNVAGAPQIADGLLSQSMEIGCGGITAMMVAWEKTKAAHGQAMKGMVALSSIPYELLTVDPAIKSLKDLGAKNKIGMTAIKVSIPAIFLQMAAEREFGEGNWSKLDPLTVSLAQPDGATSLLSGGGTVDSYIFAPPFNYQLRERPGIRRIWSSTELTGGAITSLAMWTTSRFREENPRTYGAVIAAMRDAVSFVRNNRREAATIFIKVENSKLPLDFVTSVLGEPDLAFDVVPQHSLDLARFLARTGLLKSPPAEWKDYFFPEIHGESGS